jgi:hypothetical protein
VPANVTLDLGSAKKVAYLGINLPSNRGAQFIDLNVASARYIRLTMNGTWATSGSSQNRIGIDEMWVGGSYA